LIGLIAMVGTAAPFLLPGSISVPVDAAGWLTLALLLRRSGRQQRRLHEALDAAHHEHARLGGRLTAERDELTTQRDELTSQLDYWATHDPLTRLANRSGFSRAVADALAAGQPCGVMTLSLAEFSEVNSTYGASSGDQVLQAVTGRLQRALRDQDLAGRLGGDEFGVLLRGLEATNAQAAGDRLLRIFNDPIVVGDASVVLRARAGVAVTPDEQWVDAPELLRRSELAAAASQPNDVVNVYAPAMQAVVADRLRLESDMRRAAAAREFINHYQPLVSTSDGHVRSVEALVRWAHPARGMVSPQEFIPAAEQSGIIVELGLAVLRQACQHLAVWQQATDGAFTVAVNLSARQLSEPGIVESVRDIVWGIGIDPRHLVLEITESLLVEDSDAAIATLWQLRGMGFRLAVDDFGTGYSSLSRLSDMPIDEMKIDKSFVDRIGAPANDSSPIIAAAVAMGHALGLTVVAEGVETEAQAAFLGEINCDLLQGYVFSRPVDHAGIAPLLNRALFDPTALAGAGNDPDAADRQLSQLPVPRVLPSAQSTTGRRFFAR
jgi:diguanylate cyclase (GGDEF)-like protein